MRLLVVDDDARLRDVFCRQFSIRGHAARSSGPEEALQAARSFRPDVVLLDICMPDLDGISLLRRFRADPDLARVRAVLMTGLPAPQALLTAASDGLGDVSIHMKAHGVETLLSSLTRPREREDAVVPARHLRRGPFTVDLDHRRVWLRDREIPAPRHRRFDLMCALLRAGAPVSREDLLRDVWPGSDNLNTVDVCVSRLRRDLAPARVSIVRERGGYAVAAA